MHKEDVLLKSLETFTLQKGEMKATKGGRDIVKIVAKSGVFFLDVDTQTYYDITGKVYSRSEY